MYNDKITKAIAAAQDIADNDPAIHAGVDRKATTKVWEKDSKSRTYIDIRCYSLAGNLKGTYKCGYIDNLTGEYVHTQYDDVDLTDALTEEPATEEPEATMQGTERQIALATEIKATVKAIFEQYLEEAKAYPMCPNLEANIAGTQARLAALEACNQAGDIIDCFKDIKRTGNIQKDIPAVLAVYKIKYADSASMHALLCK